MSGEKIRQPLPVLPPEADGKERPPSASPAAGTAVSGTWARVSPPPVALGAPGRYRVRRLIRWAAAAVVLVASLGSLGGLLSLALLRRGPQPQPARTRIVVSDFTELTSPSRPGVLGRAVAAAVVAQLATVPSFDVASGSVAEASTDGARSPCFRVTGSVLRSGARVRVNFALVDAGEAR